MNGIMAFRQLSPIIRIAGTVTIVPWPQGVSQYSDKSAVQFMMEIRLWFYRYLISNTKY